MSLGTAPPRRASSTDGRRPTPPRRQAHPAVRRTLLALLASCLGVVPLQSLFTDSGWLLDVWFSAVVVVGPAVLLRLRRPPGALDIWPGIVLLVPWLTLRFLGDTAFAGIVPTGQTWSALSTLMSRLHETTREEVAPIHTTVAVRLVLCALVGLLAALVDLIAVVGRRGALAGVPLLIVFTVSGAVPRQPVAWPWFAVAAAGFLLLLAVDARDEHEQWGRRVRAPGRRGTGRNRGGSALAVTAPRIAVIAVLVAVLLPLVVPGESRNLLANAFHGGSGSGGSGDGSGGRISPFANLKGQLNERTTRTLARVQMLGRGEVDPYYLRTNVLSEFTDKGWRQGSHGELSDISDGDFPIAAGGSPESVSLAARIDVTGLREPGVFNYPTSITGLDGARWSRQDQLLQSVQLRDGDQYTVRFAQPDPTVQQLRDAPGDITPEVSSQLEVPRDLSDYVRNLVRDQIAGATTPYAKARRLSDFFANPDNGFTYSLQTKDGDSDDDLVTFLQERQGFCQQYAAAMAVMLRVADVPARVVLGYLNSGPDGDGRFDVTTRDAHAWVEAWFSGIGWVPFDPTPASGLPGGGGTLAWAPRDNETSGPSGSTSAAPTTRSTTTAPSSAAASSTTSETAPQAVKRSPSSDSGWLLAAALVLALGLALSPAALRSSRRRQRYLAARRDGNAEALWAELTDTAVDLGYVWSRARSPRQVAAWLAPQAPGAQDALRALADAVERTRYAGGAGGAAPAGVEVAVRALGDVTGELRDRRSTRTRLRARLWPASLGWTARLGRLGGLGLGSGLGGGRGRREL